jgi:hypothetical protein
LLVGQEPMLVQINWARLFTLLVCLQKLLVGQEPMLVQIKWSKNVYFTGLLSKVIGRSRTNACPD